MEAVYIEVEKTLLCMSAHPFEPSAYLFLCTERESQKGGRQSVGAVVGGHQKFNGGRLLRGGDTRCVWAVMRKEMQISGRLVVTVAALTVSRWLVG